jgi:hypothetical protein
MATARTRPDQKTFSDAKLSVGMKNGMKKVEKSCEYPK